MLGLVDRFSFHQQSRSDEALAYEFVDGRERQVHWNAKGTLNKDHIKKGIAFAHALCEH